MKDKTNSKKSVLRNWLEK